MPQGVGVRVSPSPPATILWAFRVRERVFDRKPPKSYSDIQRAKEPRFSVALDKRTRPIRSPGVEAICSPLVNPGYYRFADATRVCGVPSGIVNVIGGFDRGHTRRSL